MSASGWLVATCVVFLAVELAAWLEEVLHERRPAQRLLCPCGCGRTPGQHVEPYAVLLDHAKPSPVIRIPGQHRRAES